MRAWDLQPFCQHEEGRADQDGESICGSSVAGFMESRWDGICVTGIRKGYGILFVGDFHMYCLFIF